MSRYPAQRPSDIAAAIAVIRTHLDRGELSDGLVFDAVRVRLIEIGEAVKGLDETLLASEPAIPWSHITGMRDQLAHRYFDTSHAIVSGTITHDLAELERAVQRLAERVGEE
ncbi:MAG TPA: HepT-like ribonuclease domain-containing protein [Mycobacteriales bacterium]|nr:HepT-like ribonuclease domain-containing protein [Mycobacteriales bacterium]